MAALLLTANRPAADTTAEEPPAQVDPSAWNHPLPIGAGWALQRGIELPNPFGAGLFGIYMSRDYKVNDVRVTLAGDEPVSVGDIASFNVRNNTVLAALKLDAWILPVLNVYALIGQSWTDSRLTASVTVDRILGDPITFELTQDTNVGGPLFGAGATTVAGYGHWFILADANYNYSNIELFDEGMSVWFLSARTGWSGKIRPGLWRAWAGAAYLAAERTISITQEEPPLGTVVVAVDQGPANPWTFQTGGSLGFGRRWETLLEVGSNFDDAFVGVLSASYRF